MLDKPPADCTANVIAWHDIPSTTTNKPAAAAGVDPSMDLTEQINPALAALHHMQLPIQNIKQDKILQMSQT